MSDYDAASKLPGFAHFQGRDLCFPILEELMTLQATAGIFQSVKDFGYAMIHVHSTHTVDGRNPAPVDG